MTSRGFKKFFLASEASGAVRAKRGGWLVGVLGFGASGASLGWGFCGDFWGVGWVGLGFGFWFVGFCGGLGFSGWFFLDFSAFFTPSTRMVL